MVEYFDMLKNWSVFRKFLDGPKLETYLRWYCSVSNCEYKKDASLIEMNPTLIDQHLKEYKKTSDPGFDNVCKKLSISGPESEPYKYCYPHDCPQSNIALLPGFISDFLNKKIGELYIVFISLIMHTDKGFYCWPFHVAVSNNFIKPGIIIEVVEKSDLVFYDLILPMLHPDYEQIQNSSIGIISCETVQSVWNKIKFYKEKVCDKLID